jgi:hypothetical protein
MEDDSRPYVDDIVAAVRERRVGADTALAWLELRSDEHARYVREVRAHADAAMRDRLHSAVDSALSGGTEDEFSKLFDPRRPLGPATHEEEPSESVVYDAPDRQGNRARPRPAASALSDDELFDALFPDGYRWRPGFGGE